MNANQYPQITDLAEVAKLIRKHKRARVWLHTASGCLTGSVPLGTHTALDALKDGAFDHFTACDRDGTIYLNDETAEPALWVPRVHPRKVEAVAKAWRALEAARVSGHYIDVYERNHVIAVRELNQFEVNWAAHLPATKVAQQLDAADATTFGHRTCPATVAAVEKVFA